MPKLLRPATFTMATVDRHPSSLPACKRRHLSRALHPRDVLIACGVLIALIVPAAPSQAEPTKVQQIAAPSVAAPFAAFVSEASRRFGIPAAWIRAVMRAESVGDARAISPKGAIGLMQIMPETWSALRQRYRLGSDPYDAHDNIIAGAAYLRELHDRYGIPGFLAAYNAGSARWEDHLATGRALPVETRAYLARLAPIVGDGAADDTVLLASIMRSWTEASLFPEHPSNATTATPNPARQQDSNTSNARPAQDWTGLAPNSDGLFVALTAAGRSQ